MSSNIQSSVSESRKSGGGRSATWVIAILAVILVVGAAVLLKSRWLPRGGGSAAGGGYDSPEAAFEVQKKAMAEKDWKTLVGVISPELQEQMAADAVMTAMQLSRADPEMKAMCSRHGLDVDALQKSWDRPADGAQPPAPPGEKMKMMMEQSKQAAAALRDRAGFFAEIMARIDQLQGKQQVARVETSDWSSIATAKLTELRIEGDSAKGVGVLSVGGNLEAQPVTFQRVSGRWYLSKPLEVPRRSMGPKPAGNKGRPTGVGKAEEKDP